MLINAHFFFRGATQGELRLRLRRLRTVSRAAQNELCRRRSRSRRAQEKGAAFSSTTASSSSSAGVHLEWLPKNDALESAIAFAISENRDARTELEFTRHFLSASFLSLASPVGPWDPYDTKPQVFALDQYIAIPVFTSLAYLRLFCRRFRFTVRDPSGVLWADGVSDENDDVGNKSLPLLLPDVSKSGWWKRHVQQYCSAPALEPTSSHIAEEVPGKEENKEEGAAGVSAGGSGNKGFSWLNACDLFSEMGTLSEEGPLTTSAVKKTNKKKKRASCVSSLKKKGRMKSNNGSRVRGACGEKEETSRVEHNSRIDDAVREAFWARVRATAPFNIKQATPIPMFGPLLRPFFVGYFADVDTLLHNASIVPEKVDIVLNPTSPIEFVLAREATDRVLHKDQLLFLAYRRVEKEICREFHHFFHYFAPEVAWARSACVPCPVPGRPGEVKYELVVLLESDDFDRTLLYLRAAKLHCLLMGHADLDVLPWNAASPHVRESSSLFYRRAMASDKTRDAQSGGVLGVFEQKGSAQTVSVAQAAEGFYHDPTAAYTESHAIFTEELKLKRDLL